MKASKKIFAFAQSEHSSRSIRAQRERKRRRIFYVCRFSPREQTPPPRSRHPREQTPPGETATAADGTHPTGMHSCFLMFLAFASTFFRCESVLK